eukprot:7865454-Pyramimonas_sp.AAC.1
MVACPRMPTRVASSFIHVANSCSPRAFSCSPVRPCWRWYCVDSSRRMRGAPGISSAWACPWKSLTG